MVIGGGRPGRPAAALTRRGEMVTGARAETVGSCVTGEGAETVVRISDEDLGVRSSDVGFGVR
jgi:hypothetical protein